MGGDSGQHTADAVGEDEMALGEKQSREAPQDQKEM